MNPKRNYWRDLKCKPGSDREQLKSAYRAIARATHADAHQGSNEHRESFEAAVGAWKVLGDDQKRLEWWLERQAWLKDCGAIECTGCGSAIKIGDRIGTQRCPLCKTEVADSKSASDSDTMRARLYQPLADSGRRIGAQLVDATEIEAERLGRELVTESGKLLGQLILRGFSAARRRLRGK